MNKLGTKSISLGEMILVIWKKKSLICIVCLICFILIGIIANPARDTYSATFEYDFPGIEMKKYPDESNFDYRSIICSESLGIVKNSNDKYADIDINKMYSSNGISIKEVTKKVNNEVVAVLGSYTIEAKTKYFKNKKQATHFLQDLISLPYETALEKINHLDHFDYLDSSATTAQYAAQIEFLLLQKLLLETGYDTLIERYGDLYIDEKKVSKHKIELDKFFVDNNISLLIQELDFYGYVKNFEHYESQLLMLDSKLAIEYEDNQKEIDRLNEQIRYLLSLASAPGSIIQTFESYNKIIAEKVIRNVEIERERLTIASKLNGNNVGVSAFNDKLDFFTTNLYKFTTVFTDIAKNTYKQDCKITYYSNSIIIEVGGIGSIAVVVIASIIMSTMVVVMVVYKAKKKMSN